ncbi:LOW QUALITY PROTEIN: hemicentin-1-like [Scyliorhinus canicula]|uniref:LOW QUALITY PROTEIN: hemicentin-1-like n=1 Tax=Scyliorhinus canicula TaxID=7830 RepID=UPI0018F3F90B|nr:LOW QUALITY PROTEIN: hemicentin-1-like [Scyliorhinus canicula]
MSAVGFFRPPSGRLYPSGVSSWSNHVWEVLAVGVIAASVISWIAYRQRRLDSPGSARRISLPAELLLQVAILAGAVFASYLNGSQRVPFTVKGPDSLTVVHLGEDVVLSCLVVPFTQDRKLWVEWKDLDTRATILMCESDRTEPCQALGGRAHLFVGQPAAGNVSIGLRGVKKSDAGTYRCTVNSDGQSSHVDMELAVVVPFTVKGPDSLTVAHLGEDVVLSCLVVPFTQDMKLWVEWKDLDTRATILMCESDRTEPCQALGGRAHLFVGQPAAGNVSIGLRGVKESDTGTYRCTVSSDGQSSHVDMELTVVVPFTVKGPDSLTVAHLGEDVVLSCLVVPFTQDRKLWVEWKDLDNKATILTCESDRTEPCQALGGRAHLFVGQPAAGNVSIGLRGVKKSDAGTYRCTVSSDGQSSHVDMELAVVVPFTVKGPDSLTVAHMGEDVVLSCLVVPFTQDMKLWVEWKDLDTRATILMCESDRTEPCQALGGRAHLFVGQPAAGNVSIGLRGVKESDAGTYRCTVSSVGQFSHVDMELAVVAFGTKPGLSITQSDENVVAYACQSEGWYPEPGITWKDGFGNSLVPLSTITKVRDEQGLYNVDIQYRTTDSVSSTVICIIYNKLGNVKEMSTAHVIDFLPHAQFRVSEAEWSRIRSFQGKRTVQERSEVLGRFCFSLTLDPDTANPWLILSDGGTSVSDSNERQHLPNPKRFLVSHCVLASGGFAAGKHYWETEVGHKDTWDLGLASETVSRKGKVKGVPGAGHWSLSLSKTEYQAVDSPPRALPLGQNPTVVGVYLNYERGQVSFFDAGGQLHLYTFAVNFTKRLYPFFCPGLHNWQKNAEPLHLRNRKPLRMEPGWMLWNDARLSGGGSHAGVRA